MYQGREQAGFRKGHATSNQLFILNQLIQKSREYNMDTYLFFIYFHKAFNTVDHSFLWKTLKSQGIEEKYRIIKNIYTDAKALVKTDKRGQIFQIEKGVRQGDPLSPNLFNSAPEEIFRNLRWE